MSKVAHLGTVTLDTKLATSKQLNADEILANGEDVAEMFNREHAYREMETRVKLQPEDNYILYTDDGTIVTANLSGVANGTRLFSNQSKLTEIPLSWKLDSITDGTSMCESCTNLTTFSFPLNSLSNGSGMFANCNLNEKSVENILKTIPEYADGTHTLTLKMSNDAFEKFNEITGNYLMAPGTISYKGWSIASNAIITIPVEELTNVIEEIVGEGKVIVETVPAENKVVVHTDRVDDTQLEAVTALLEQLLLQNVEAERYNHNLEVNWRDINKYAECVTPADFMTVAPDKTSSNNPYGTYLTYCTSDLTSDGEFPYTLTKLSKGNWHHVDGGLFKKVRGDVKMYLPGLKTIYDLFSIGNQITSVELDAPQMNSCTQGFIFDRCSILKRVKINGDGKVKTRDMMWFFRNCSQLEDVQGFDYSSTYRITAVFNNCKLNKKSAIDFLLGIPKNGGNTDVGNIGIHVDHQNDDEVLAAIAEAEAKGWALAVQWNGTPTAQAATTYGLRKAPIYAKVSELELPDGTTERYLNWGHYVTDPTGYEEFASVEEAREYYGLPDENIEEELTNV